MEAIQKILLAVDFGPASEAAGERAAAIAKVFGAEIHVVHVYEAPVYPYPHPPVLDVDALVASLERRAHAGVEVVARKLAAELGDDARVASVLRQGSAWRNILDVAAELDADLVVMGTHGRTGVERVLIGSVAEKVVRMSPVPVLIVPVHEG